MNDAKKITLDTEICFLKGVGEKRAELFAKLGISTIADLLSHKPRRFDDFSKISQIAELNPGRVTVKARILEIKGRYLGYRGLHLTEALVGDETGYLRVVWFNQPYRINSFKSEGLYYLSGLYDLKYKHLQLINPSVEAIDKEEGNLNLIKPIYPTTLGLKSLQIQKAIFQAKPFLENIKENLPAWMVEKANLPTLPTSYEKLHFPQTIEEAEEALAEFSLRELIALSLSSQLLKLQRQSQKSTPMSFKKEAFKSLVESLPFALTDQQNQITLDILKEMSQKDITLNRLIQGDVGAGKTVIAALIAFNAVKNGYQVAFLAPTHILARQHFQNLREIYQDSFKSSAMEVFTSALPTKDRTAILKRIEIGETQLIIGTHALFFRRS